jgi:flagella basal body P-ring formation protein FlgA
MRMPLLIAVVLLMWPVVANQPPLAQSLALQSAETVIRAAVVARVGARADVSVRAIDPAPDGPVKEARPDPAAILNGKPIRFTLIRESGTPLITYVKLSVSSEHAIAARPIERNHPIAVGDLTPVTAELTGVPMRPTATVAMLTGGRALRPIPAGAVVLTSYVATRRAIEPGDKVTVLAVSGDVEVSAVLIAADGGPIGATIRVVNPDTRRQLRGRVVGDGIVEVINGR